MRKTTIHFDIEAVKANITKYFTVAANMHQMDESHQEILEANYDAATDSKAYEQAYIVLVQNNRQAMGEVFINLITDFKMSKAAIEAFNELAAETIHEPTGLLAWTDEEEIIATMKQINDEDIVDEQPTEFSPRTEK